MSRKKCTQCKLEKDYSDFTRDKRTKSGLYSSCKKCHGKFRRKWKAEHPEFWSNWVKNNRERWNQYRREWVNRSPKNRIDNNVRSKICRELKGEKAGRHWQDLVGYKLSDLVKHRESQFDERMSWGNYGPYWEIDHIKPLSFFKYETAEDPEFKECWALKNLRPLEASMNRSKSNKYPL